MQLKKSEWQLINEDFTHLQWPRCDVIYASSTCFDKQLMNTLGEVAQTQPLGCFFVTLTKNIPDQKWKVVRTEKMKMSWGEATVYIHKKVEV